MNVEILLDTFFVDCFCHRDNSSLVESTENGLGHALFVLGRHLNQRFVMKRIVPSFGERGPRFKKDAVLIRPFLCFELLVENVDFNLIDHGLDLAELANVDEPVGIEIGDADRSAPSLPVDFFQIPISSIVICDRLMEED